TPTATFKATLNGSAAKATWSVDRGDIGSVPAAPASSVAFTPTGTTGGVATLTARADGQTLTRSVLVKIVATQNGPNTSSPAEAAQIAASVSQLSSGGGI